MSIWQYIRATQPGAIIGILLGVGLAVLVGLATAQPAHADSREAAVPPTVLGNLYVISTIPGETPLQVGDEIAIGVVWRTPTRDEAGCYDVNYGQAPGGPKKARVMVRFPNDMLYGIAAPPNNIGGTGLVGIEVDCGQEGISYYRFRIYNKRPDWWRNPTETFEVYIPQIVQTGPTLFMALPNASFRQLNFRLDK